MSDFRNSCIMKEKRVRRIAREIMETLEKNNLGIVLIDTNDEDRTVQICIVENIGRPYCLPIRNLEPYYDVNISAIPHLMVDGIILS